MCQVRGLKELLLAYYQMCYNRMNHAWATMHRLVLTQEEAEEPCTFVL
jgi:hypothetical protein